MNKLSLMIKNWKTTLASLLPLISGIAIALGFVNLEQSTAIIDGTSIILESADSILNEIVGATSIITGIGLLFSKDADKSSKELGI